MSYQTESELLGTILSVGVTPDASDTIEALSAKMFVDQNHASVFEVIKHLHINSLPVTLGSILERKPEVYETACVLHKQAVSQKAIQRLTIAVKTDYNGALAARMIEKALASVKEDPSNYHESIARLEANLQTLESPDSDSEPLSMESYAMGYIDLMEARLHGNEEATGLDIGLDTPIGRTDLVIIAGSSGQGKTSCAMYCKNYVASKGKKVLSFSLEMEGMQLFEREVTRVGRIDSNALKDPVKYDLDYSAMTNGVAAAKQLPIYIDDSSKLDLLSFKRKARRFKAKNPDLAMIVIDYLTLMDLPTGDRRDLALTDASRQLKLMAKELKTPIVLLAQLGKEVGRSGREPVKEDIRDGAIENDADKIFMPYRDDVNNPDSPNAGMAKVIKAKVRDGATGAVLMRFEHGNFYPADNYEWQYGNAKQEARKYSAKKD